MATASVDTNLEDLENVDNSKAWKAILLPYGLAVLAQLPMLVLYFRQLWARPHYQSFPFAIIAVAVIAFIRWPFKSDMPFHRSLASDILLVAGLVSAVAGALFVEPWFAALSVLLLITSLFARTIDQESKRSLWACAIPLFVCLSLPNNYDNTIITRLQYYSANFTSRILDLLGLGHHMDGVVIIVPGMKKYGVEEACSGVVSFFTLLAITTVFIVWARRISTPNPIVSILLIGTGVVIALVEQVLLGGFGYYALGGLALITMGCFGFRATMLLMSAIFWALFMNTVRIMLIPISDYQLGIDLSTGVAHDILGYLVLFIGILLVLSTDQFLLFMFGSVEQSAEEGGPIGRTIAKFWNHFLAGGKTEEDEDGSRRRKRRKGRKPINQMGRILIWTVAGIMIACGLWQLVDVQRSMASDYKVRFFDSDVTMDFEQNDIPEFIGDNWKQVKYETEDRKRGSDLGKRSDTWYFQAPRCRPVASLDQTFPGWHELTTCYKNQGWRLVEDAAGRPQRIRLTPETIEGEEPWQYIEAEFERDTGERGYLLFSHFDAFGNPVEAPESWGSVNSFLTRASNRLSHRIRANLFDGEVYQTQVFMQSFGEFDQKLKDEAKARYLKIRQQMRQRFVEKRAAETG